MCNHCCLQLQYGDGRNPAPPGILTKHANVGAPNPLDGGMKQPTSRGDRLAAADTFREFVVYDADQIYPDTFFLERTNIII